MVCAFNSIVGRNKFHLLALKPTPKSSKKLLSDKSFSLFILGRESINVRIFSAFNLERECVGCFIIPSLLTNLLIGLH